MTLLITVFAALFVTYKWYVRNDDTLQLGSLALMFWGASIMWFVDAVFEFASLKAEYFAPAGVDMLNDAFLGLCVVALGLIIWMVRLLITDPKGTLKAALKKQM